MCKKWTHPELLPGEVLLSYISPGDFEEIGWESKRMGEKAYLLDGKAVLPETVPVFVQVSELINAGIDPTKLWDKDWY